MDVVWSLSDAVRCLLLLTLGFQLRAMERHMPEWSDAADCRTCTTVHWQCRRTLYYWNGEGDALVPAQIPEPEDFLLRIARLA